MNPQRLLRVLRARHVFVWSSVLAFACLSLLYCSLATKQYTATARMLLDAREPDLLQQQQMGSYSVLAPTYIATQVDILHSDRVADIVIKSLGLDTSAQAIAQWEKSREGNATLNQYYAEVLGKFLLVTPSRTSNTLSLAFTNPNPVFAAAAANAYAKAYLEVSAQLRADPAKSYAGWFAERTKEERERLESAQQRLSTYQRENGIVANDERLDVENARLTELNTQLTMVQGQLAESASREKTAQGRMNASPDVLHSGVVENLRSEIARNEAKLHDLGKEYGERHPAYQRAVAELDALRVSLKSEMEKVASSVGASNDVNVEREAEVREALRRQKEKVLQLRNQRDQVAVLQRDVDAAQRAYDLVAQRLSQTGIESQVKSTNIVVLEDARVPVKQSSPRPVKYTLIAVIVGLFFGLGLALAMEQRRPRLRSASDVVDVLGVPVLGSLRSAARGRRFFKRRELVPA